MSGIILYIEHRQENMLLVQLAVEGIGLTLFGARSGQEGLARARLLYPAVILLSLDLPDMDGCEVARRLRSDPDEDLRGVPIIAFDSRPGQGSCDRPGQPELAIAAGCDIFMRRPINIYDLWVRIETFLAIGGY